MNASEGVGVREVPIGLGLYVVAAGQTIVVKCKVQVDCYPYALLINKAVQKAFKIELTRDGKSLTLSAIWEKTPRGDLLKAGDFVTLTATNNAPHELTLSATLCTIAVMSNAPR